MRPLLLQGFYYVVAQERASLRLSRVQVCLDACPAASQLGSSQRRRPVCVRFMSGAFLLCLIGRHRYAAKHGKKKDESDDDQLAHASAPPLHSLGEDGAGKPRVCTQATFSCVPPTGQVGNDVPSFASQ
jgi:hypothetical protein